MTKVRLSSSSRDGQADGAAYLGLVGLAVAEEGPDVRPAGVLQLASQQIAVEPGLMDCIDRAEAHGYRRELPEVRHQPRVRVGRQAAAGMRELLPEAVQLLLAEPALQEGAGVDAGCGMSLEKDLVAGLAVILAAEEVVEADLVETGRGRIGRDMAADTEARPVGAADHDGRVPPDISADAALDVLIAGEPGLALGRDRIDEVRTAQAGNAHLLLTRTLQETEHDIPGTSAPVSTDDVVEGLHPFPGLVRVDIRQLGGQSVADDGETLASGGHG